MAVFDWLKKDALNNAIQQGLSSQLESLNQGMMIGSGSDVASRANRPYDGSVDFGSQKEFDDYMYELYNKNKDVNPSPAKEDIQLELPLDTVNRNQMSIGGYDVERQTPVPLNPGETPYWMREDFNDRLGGEGQLLWKDQLQISRDPLDDIRRDMDPDYLRNLEKTSPDIFKDPKKGGGSKHQPKPGTDPLTGMPLDTVQLPERGIPDELLRKTLTPTEYKNLQNLKIKIRKLGIPPIGYS